MTAKKYVKKPIIIEALQWNGNSHRAMWDFLENKPSHSIEAGGRNFYINHNKVEGGLIIKTLEGEHTASIGDFIIKGINGEFYPCKPDIFEKTYEKVESEEVKTDSPFLDNQITQLRKCQIDRDILVEVIRVHKANFSGKPSYYDLELWRIMESME